MFPGQWNSFQCYHFAPKSGLLAGAHESICLAFWKMHFSCVLVKIWPKLLERLKNKMEHSCILPGFGGMRHLPRAFSSTFAKLSNLVEPIGKRGWAVGCNFWENIRDLLPVAGEHIPWNGRKCYFCQKNYSLFNFVSFQEASCITYQLPKQLEALPVNIPGVGLVLSSGDFLDAIASPSFYLCQWVSQW